MNFTAPVWRHFQRAKKPILIEAIFVDLPAASAENNALGVPVATNSDGTVAWILSSDELSAFKKSLNEMPEANQLGSPRIQNGDGMQASMFQGNSLPGLGRVGLGMDVTATIVSPAIRLLAQAESTALMKAPPGNISSLKTNLTLACRVLVPNGGGLVLLGAAAKEPSATNHWIILSPTIVTQRGQSTAPRNVILRKM